MTESPYAALQPGDQVWLHYRGTRGGPAQERVLAVRRTRMDITRYGSDRNPVTVSRITGRDKEDDGFYWIRTMEQNDESVRLDAAFNTLSKVGLRFDSGRSRAMPLATLERLAAVIREDTA